jgi:hypothetical protein
VEPTVLYCTVLYHILLINGKFPAYALIYKFPA